ncbi:MAG: hypothetical protein GY777_27240 [Candidatus Brocadiaceae bacterium]|nr:hypothetical protein [Candidatus Brocadiaceae bacterium]
MNYRKMTKEKLISEIKLLKSKLVLLERKRLEVDLEKHDNQLEKHAAKQGKELTITKKKLQLEIDERKKTEERFCGVAHDFNNRLQLILGYITLAKRQTKKNEQIHEILEDAKKAIFQSKNLSRQLLIYSKGRKPIKKIME